MSQLQGTLLIATVRPNNSLDNFAVALTNEIKGGSHSYSTFSELDLIPTDRRQVGMIATVTNDTDDQLNSSFVLQSDLVTWRYLQERYIITTQLDNLVNNYKWSVLLSSTYRFKIDKVFTKTTAGSCNITFLVNNNSIAGLDILNVTDVLDTVSSTDPTNYINFEETLDVLINNISINLSSLHLQVELLRILPKPIVPTYVVCGLQDTYFNSFSTAVN